MGAPGADLPVKPPSTRGHESVIQRRPSLSHPGGLKYFFSDIQSITLNYHTPRRKHILDADLGDLIEVFPIQDND